jgi:tRNA threonylcarbamoyladenosine biosynthesis protein TsaB
MLILAIDTSGRHGSVALCRGDANSFATLQMAALEGGTYSARLIPTISELLQQHNVALAELDAFAIVSGPGSFTGARVGLATVKGLCEIVHKPLAIVSMLEAIAVTHRQNVESVTAVLDAGRGELYVGEYRVGQHSAMAIREYIAKLPAFAEEARKLGELLTPDPAIADFLREKGISVGLIPAVQADDVARIGLRKLQAGEVADHASVDVNYIRRSDAEILSAAKR